MEEYGDLANDSTVSMFEKYKVLTGREIHSRYEISLEQYAKHINIEARCALQMTRGQYIPSVIAYTGELAETVNALKSAGADTTVPAGILAKINELLLSASKKLAALESATAKANGIEDVHKKAKAFHDSVFTAQSDLRKDIDALESLLPGDFWPVPTYQEMLFDL